MKRFAAILFASCLLLSSGMVQFAVHLCPEKGALLSAEQCHMHAKPAACCQKMAVVKKTDDCCNESYVYAVSPKFGQVEQGKLVVFSMEIESFRELQNYNAIQPDNRQIPAEKSGKPPRYNRQVLTESCTLII